MKTLNDNFLKRKVFKSMVIVLCTMFFFYIIAKIDMVYAASSFIEDEQADSNAQLLFRRYTLSNYNLCYSSEDKGWFEFIDKGTAWALYAIANIFWVLSYYVSYGIQYLLSEAFSFSFLDNLSNGIGNLLQRLLGISSSGVSGNGLFMSFASLAIVALGIFVAYKGLAKRETTAVLGKLASFVIIFVLLAGFVMNAGTMIGRINEVSTGIQNEVLEVGIKFTSDQANVSTDNTSDLVRDNLFRVQIYEPWKELNLENDMSNIDESAEEILALSPNSDERQEILDSLVADSDNIKISAFNQSFRIGNVLILMIVNLAISIFVGMLAIACIMSQVNLVIYVVYTPFAMIISLFPSQDRKVYDAIRNLFNALLARAGISLALIVGCVLSSLVYQLDLPLVPFLFKAILQVVLWAGVALNLPKFLKMFGLSDTASGSVAGKAKSGMKGAVNSFIGNTGALGFAGLLSRKKDKGQRDNNSTDSKPNDNAGNDRTGKELAPRLNGGYASRREQNMQRSSDMPNKEKPQVFNADTQGVNRSNIKADTSFEKSRDKNSFRTKQSNNFQRNSTQGSNTQSSNAIGRSEQNTKRSKFTYSDIKKEADKKGRGNR